MTWISDVSAQSKDEAQVYLENAGILDSIPDWEKRLEDARDAIEAQVIPHAISHRRTATAG